MYYYFFFQAEDGIRDIGVTGVQTCALPIYRAELRQESPEFIEAHGRLALVSGTQHGAAARQGGSRRQGNATHEAAARRLEYLHGDSAAGCPVAPPQISQNNRGGGPGEKRPHHT